MHFSIVSKHLRPKHCQNTCFGCVQGILRAPTRLFSVDKKTLDFVQGLDFLRLERNNYCRKHEETRKNLGTPGSKLLITKCLIRKIGCTPLVCPKHSQNTCFGCVQAEYFWIILEKIIVFFLYENLQLVYPPYDMAPLMRIPMPNCVQGVLSSSFRYFFVFQIVFPLVLLQRIKAQKS